MTLSYSEPPARWLVTGAAGFIGSHLVEALLNAGHSVIGLDNFATGQQHNIDEVALRTRKSWSRFEFINGNICDVNTVERAMTGVNYVLHNAALGSVPRSIAAPLATLATNIDGFAKVLDAARRAGVSRFLYASSSSVYGDHPALPKVEHSTGRPLSPYAASKCVDELLAENFSRTYGISCVGLRYFNVFGARQDPAGAYAAVIPRWVSALIEGRPVRIFGDGETSRDFCYVSNVVQANLRAATCRLPARSHEVINVAVGQRTTLLALFRMIRELLVERGLNCAKVEPIFEDFRAGDVQHSHASIDQAIRILGYRPTHNVREGLSESIDWYIGRRT